MPTATVTTKGQITLPKEVREALGVEAGDRVAFRIQEDGRFVVEAETVDLMSLRGSVASKRRGVSIDDMSSAIRRRGAGR